MQQVNLYRPIFRKQEKKFSAVAMMQAGTAIIVGVVVIYGLMFWQVGRMRNELQQADKRLVTATKQLDDAKQRLIGAAKGETLEERVAALEQQVSMRQRVSELLTRGLFSNTTGYSDFFIALARQHVTGMWLTRFDITGAGEDMRLQGRTTDPAQVPRFVQRLAAEPVLTGKEFQVFVMSRPEKEDDAEKTLPPPYLEFMLRTSLPKDPARKS